MPLSGIHPLNKPAGLRSTYCVQRVRGILGKKIKTGHGGTLDSTASGLLLVLVGQATRLSNFVMEMPKRYAAELAFGAATSTDDMSGAVPARAPWEHITDELIDRFGDPPESVKGLIDVSLLRNKAAALGIKEISQRTDSLLFYPEVVDIEAARRQAANLKGRVMLNAGAKPYLAVRVLKGEIPVDTMRLALDAMSPDAPRA